MAVRDKTGSVDGIGDIYADLNRVSNNLFDFAINGLVICDCQVESGRVMSQLLHNGQLIAAFATWGDLHY